MKNTLALLLLTTFVAVSCDMPTKESTQEHVYWVNSYKQPCTDGGETTCLLIVKGTDSLDMSTAEWQPLSASIEGFDYEPGHIHKLLVNETEVTEDSSTTKTYSLIEVMEKNIDARLRVNDIWVLESLNGEAYVAAEGQESPMLEIQVAAGRVMGNDGCNNFRGTFTTLTDTELAFGPLMTTRKACPDMETPKMVEDALNQVASYTVESLSLKLYDADGNEVLSYKKVD